jgi:hypothetical protein
VQVYFGTISGLTEYIRAGKLRALAVTTSTCSEALPDIPTVGDFLPGYEASGWQGVGVPKSTPAEIIGKLNREINAAIGNPRVKARLADLGGTTLPGSPNDFSKFIAEETEKWGKVIRAANKRRSDESSSQHNVPQVGPRAAFRAAKGWPHEAPRNGVRNTALERRKQNPHFGGPVDLLLYRLSLTTAATVRKGANSLAFFLGASGSRVEPVTGWD